MHSDPRQFDMFAALAPTVAPALIGPIPPEVQRDFDDEDFAARFSFAGSKVDWSDEEREAWVRQWDLHKREWLRGEEAEALGEIETIGWMSGAPGKQMGFSKPGYRLCVWNDFGRWRIKESLDLHNSGSGGPWSGPYTSRNEAVLTAFRRIISRSASAAARGESWEDEAKRSKQLAQLARWCCEQMPPLASGVDLAAELEQLTAVAKEEHARRCAALNRQHEIEERARAAIRAAGGLSTGFGSDSYIGDEATKGLEFHARFVGEWAVKGPMPDGLEAVVYEQPDHRAQHPDPAPVLRRALEAIAAAVDVPTRMATPEEYGLCHSDRRRVTW